jgi:hypothetical protein
VTTGIARIRDGLAATEETGTRVSAPLFLTLLAEALALAGKIEEGLVALDDALAQVADSGAKGWDAEIHRLRGELTGRLPYPDPAKAEDSFRTALAIAREQGTRGYELRAATSLARQWRAQGRPGEARDLLAPLYGWFTEGFDTPDLKDAGALLDELTRAGRRHAHGLLRMTVSSETRRSCARPQTALERLTSRFQRGNANGRKRVGFRMPARREQSIPGKGGGPSSESLRRANPRDSGEELTVYGDLVARRRWRGMVLRRLVRAESR